MDKRNLILDKTNILYFFLEIKLQYKTIVQQNEIRSYIFAVRTYPLGMVKR